MTLPPNGSRTGTRYTGPSLSASTELRITDKLYRFFCSTTRYGVFATVHVLKTSSSDENSFELGRAVQLGNVEEDGRQSFKIKSIVQRSEAQYSYQYVPSIVRFE
jgi:hypothetical protein